ncbi:hypothetical protein C0214_04810 [Methylobacterium sp. DM1]|nr:hypothetical protein C0214_04810 [Methylobacterium sp. DM1]
MKTSSTKVMMVAGFAVAALAAGAASADARGFGHGGFRHGGSHSSSRRHRSSPVGSGDPGRPFWRRRA